MELRGSMVGVMGLGLSGTATARFLLARGAMVIVSESRPESELQGLAAELRAEGATVECGGHSRDVFLGCSLVVVSPGVPPSVDALRASLDRGGRIVSEIELAGRFLQGRIAAITGSNGKSTVTALAASILNESGLRARPCGNIGLPMISLVGPPAAEVHVKDLGRPQPTGGDAPDVVYVAEVSSFQLEAIDTFHPRVAAVLNLSPDHQDRYESPADYYAAKARVFMNQTADDAAILNADDPQTWALRSRVRARLIPFSLAGNAPHGVLLQGDELVHVEAGGATPLIPISEIPLPGRHNLENVAAAAAIARAFGAPPGAIRRGVRGFKALPHRLKFVRKVRGVEVYDDSKATNVGSTIRAVEAFQSPIVLLLGGRDKGGDFASLAPHLASRVRAIVTFGEAGPHIAASLKGSLRVIEGGPLRDAARSAMQASQPGDVVLLAPACASFDAYSGYAARGDDFVRIIGEIAEGSGEI